MPLIIPRPVLTHCRAKLPPDKAFCQTPVEAGQCMCPEHWAMVPREIRQQIKKHYRPGIPPTRELGQWVVRAMAVVYKLLEMDPRLINKPSKSIENG